MSSPENAKGLGFYNGGLEVLGQFAGFVVEGTLGFRGLGFRV